MGAGNVKLAYGHWAGKVPPGSLLVLVFMALVTKDSDDPALFWGGHESLALSVLGRRGPFTETDARAVKRLVTPLFKAGAVEVERHSAPGRRVRYQLILHPNRGRKPSPEQGTESGRDTGRNPSPDIGNRSRKAVGTGDGNRPPQEEEQEELLQDISRTKARPGAQGSTRATPDAERIDTDEPPGPRECVQCHRLSRRAGKEPDRLCADCRTTQRQETSP